MARKKQIVPTPEAVAQRRRTVRSFRAKADAQKSKPDKIADALTASFGTIPFFIWHAVFFSIWFLWNLGFFPSLPIFDPPPFGVLTMVVSLEAIFLAIIVLISQNREERINNLREEVDLYINTYAEAEITKILYLQTLLLKKNGIDVSEDTEVQMMLESLESEEIEEELNKQLP